MGHGNQRPEIELIQAFMPVLVTNNFMIRSKMNELAWRHHFHHSRASNSKMSGLIRPKIELDLVFMPVLVTSNFDDDSIKNERTSIETPFSHCKSIGNFLDAQGQLTSCIITSTTTKYPDQNTCTLIHVY